MMKGHALRGMFGGFFFGIFLSLTLFIYGILNFADDLMWILPLVFLVIGLVFAAWAPFGGASTEPAASTAESASGPPAAEEANEEPPGAPDGGTTGV